MRIYVGQRQIRIPDVIRTHALNDLAPGVQRADNFIHWISHYPAEQIYSN